MEFRGHRRLCSINYYKKDRLLVLEGIEEGRGYTSDVPLGEKVLRSISKGGCAGFDSSRI